LAALVCLRGAAFALLAAAAAGCATVAPPRAAAPGSDAARCERAFAAADAAIEHAGVGDAYGARVPGYPYLRVDRFLASFAAEPLTAAQRERLVQLMTASESEAREVALDNLPRDAKRALDDALADGAAPADTARTLRGCAETLHAFDAASPEFAGRVARAARVPDDYETWQRVVGLYPLAALPFALGVRRYEDEIRASFATPLDRLPARGRLEHYQPQAGNRLSTEAVATLVARAPRDPLGIPQLAADEALALAWTFAPDLAIDVAGDDDRPGTATITRDGARDVDSRVPLAYVRVAYARVGGRVLLQLVYTFWFKSRPLTSAFDLLGGRLDGLVWRVTIGVDGRPLVFDSIHPCGCYHQFFPTLRAALRPLEPTLDETAFVPQRLPPLEAHSRIALRIESGTHYLQRILVDAPAPPTASRYALVPDGRLRRLPRADGGTASYFGPDGFVPGTERGERYFFWPMGIANPGAMRQWSRHATAFIGRRHFDDPLLIERYFVVR
jgi:hypothetical protein